MADFGLAVALTLRNEGGFVDNPNDPGGATKYGITQKDIPGTNVYDITVEFAADFYRRKFWNVSYDAILNQILADKLFDMGVLFGVGEAVEILQKAVGLDDDGAFGPVTLHSVNLAVPAKLLQDYKNGLVQHALGIAANRPQSRGFVTGWVNRINS